MPRTGQASLYCRPPLYSAVMGWEYEPDRANTATAPQPHEGLIST
ncbi:hypothetical protein [Komagataeibacter xylinus]|nr:hypothetical protein [Komagataeibacter xylinus]